jgi:hypothetical protein
MDEPIQATKCEHVPTYGELGYECAKCYKFLFSYQNPSPEARAVAREAKRIVDEGFTTKSFTLHFPGPAKP